MKRTALNLLIDFLAASCFIGMIATGYILHFPLPAGTNKTLVLWGLSRHQWGEVHFWISLALLVVLLIHLVLHWQWVVSVVAKQFGAREGCRVSSFRSGAIAFLAVSLALGSFAWLAEISVVQRDDAVCPPAEASAAKTQGPAAEAKPDQVDFRRDVYPILEASCLSCHGPGRAQGGFRVDRKEDFFGKNGEKPWVIPGDSRNSPLLRVVSGMEAGRMSAEVHQLSEKEINSLRAWIDGGAEWPAKE
jgi:mono/diheme cytochrome c family protein